MLLSRQFLISVYARFMVLEPNPPSPIWTRAWSHRFLDRWLVHKWFSKLNSFFKLYFTLWLQNVIFVHSAHNNSRQQTIPMDTSSGCCYGDITCTMDISFERCYGDIDMDISSGCSYGNTAMDISLGFVPMEIFPWNLNNISLRSI